jgi:hypothetical protein
VQKNSVGASAFSNSSNRNRGTSNKKVAKRNGAEEEDDEANIYMERVSRKPKGSNVKDS